MSAFKLPIVPFAVGRGVAAQREHLETLLGHYALALGQLETDEAHCADRATVADEPENAATLTLRRVDLLHHELYLREQLGRYLEALEFERRVQLDEEAEAFTHITENVRDELLKARLRRDNKGDPTWPRILAEAVAQHPAVMAIQSDVARTLNFSVLRLRKENENALAELWKELGTLRKLRLRKAA